MTTINTAIIISAKDASSAVLGSIGKSLGGIAGAATAPMRALGGVVDVLGKVGLAGMGLKAIADGVAGVATGMVAGNAQMETYETQLGTLLGSTDAAKARLAELAKFGAETPFELPEVVRAEKVLLGFGLSGEKALTMTQKSAGDLRRVIGDIAAGTGAQFEEIALTFGKFSAGATGEAISRLQELGIVTREQLSGMGIQFSRSGELTSPLPEAMAAAVKIAESKFGGGMEKLSQTFAGQMSTLSDNFNQAKIAITKPIFDVLAKNIGTVNNLLSSDAFQNGLKSFAASLGSVVSFGVGKFEQIGSAVAAFVKYLSPGNDYDLMRAWFGPDFGPKIDEVVRAVKGMIGTIGQMGADLGSVFSGKMGLGEFIEKSFGNLGDVGGKLLGALSGLMEPILDWMGQQIGPISAQLLKWGAQLAGWIGPMIPVVLGKAGEFANQLIAWIGQQIGPISAEMGEWAGAFVAWIVPATVEFLGKWPRVLDGFLDWIGKAAVPILDRLGKWALAFVEWIAPMIPPFLVALGGVALAIVIFIAETAITLGLKLAQWGLAFVSWVLPQIPPLLGKLGELLTSLGRWMVDTALPEIVKKLGAWGKAFLGWVSTSVIPFLGTELGKIWTSISGWVTDTARLAGDKAKELGAGIVKGIREGLRSMSIPLPDFSIIWETIETMLGNVSMPRLQIGVAWKPLGDLIPALAAGGIVTRPTLALLGERGPEAVVPLTGTSRAASTIVVNVNVAGSVWTTGDLVDEVYTGLLQKGLSNATLGLP